MNTKAAAYSAMKKVTLTDYEKEMTPPLTKRASLASNMLAGALIGGIVGSGKGLIEHGALARQGEFTPEVLRADPGSRMGITNMQYNQSLANGARAASDASLYTRLGGGMTTGTLYGAAAGAAYSVIADWLKDRRAKRRQERAESDMAE